MQVICAKGRSILLGRIKNKEKLEIGTRISGKADNSKDDIEKECK